MTGFSFHVSPATQLVVSSARAKRPTLPASPVGLLEPQRMELSSWVTPGLLLSLGSESS